MEYVSFWLLNMLCSSARSTIRDKIIPHAVSWFMGEAQDEDYDATILEFENDNDEVSMLHYLIYQALLLYT
jgi:hypothetical protein